MKRIIELAGFLLFILVAAASVKPSMADEVWYDVTHGINDVDLRTIAIDPFDPKTVYLGSSTNISSNFDGTLISFPSIPSPLHPPGRR